MRIGEQATISDRGQPHAAGRSPIPARPPSTPGHPGELEDVEPHGAGRAALVEQDRREPGNHPEAVTEADEHAPQDEDGKRAGAPQEEHPRDQERGRGGERRPEPTPREQPRRHIRDHAGEAEAPGEKPELPVGEALRAGDLGKERPECADTDGVREHHQAQQRRAGAAHAAIRARMGGPSTRGRRAACRRWAGA